MKKLVCFLMALILFEACEFKDASKNDTKLFKLLPVNESGLDFENTLTENDTVNYFTYPYLYMGGGVSLGDINNDGLVDIYLTGNMVQDRLYLNKGNLQFEDITLSAGVGGDNKWHTGSTMADVNGDGFLDIYVCVSGKGIPRRNSLYINNGDLTFTDMASDLGLDDPGNTIHATFFDYDRDNDLDLYVANYPITSFATPTPLINFMMRSKALVHSDRLYRNDGDNFAEVTEESGLLSYGLSISATVADLNNDQWPDLYISNDFQTPDFVYFNNGDGTFSEKVKDVTNHTSYYGMGVDIADINNDGLLDIFQVDMTPEDNRRNKANMASMNPKDFQTMVGLGMHYQYMQNCLQLNNGILKSGYPVFSDVARLTGMSNTDWSWAPLIVDLDNDGLKDVFVANGTRRDINNKDYFNSIESKPFKKKVNKTNLEKSLGIPSEPIDNYAFRNSGDLVFDNVIDEWGLNLVGFSNGASYADLDNDGDLDLVISNVDAVSTIFENQSNKISKNTFLRFELKGTEKNPFGVGAKVTLETKDGIQVQENIMSRGFQSSVEPLVHFGTGKDSIISKVTVVWPDGKFQEFRDVPTNQLVSVSYDNAQVYQIQDKTGEMLFVDVTDELNIDFTHRENEFDDFIYEPLLPHKTSNFGSGITVGDVNGDELDDFYVGGAHGQEGQLFVQNSTGKFEKQRASWQVDSIYEDMGALLFDADGDGDDDLYVVSGGNEFESDSVGYQDRLYVNLGDGSFVKSKEGLPNMVTSGSRVLPADYDGDGDIDLFVGGRLIPRRYPLPAKSYILRNDSENGKVKFVDVTNDIAPYMQELGLVTDADWVDFDNDGALDLVVTGEWMPITFLKSEGGKFVNKTTEYGFDQSTGWWFSISSADFDNDGDIDFVAGNLGLNYKYKATQEETFDVYISDYDANGSLDIVLGYYNEGVQYPVRGRECSSQQVPSIKNKFKNYDEFSVASLEDVYTEAGLSKSLHYQASTFSSSFIENKGNSVFEINALPKLAQISSVNDMIVEDFDKDGYLDIVAVGNLFASEVETTRNDASIGVFLKGDGKGDFKALKLADSGLYVSGDAKNLEVITIDKEKILVISKNNGKLQAIKVNQLGKQ